MTESLPQEAKEPARLMSVDALRGFDMIWICGGAGVISALERLFTGHGGWLSRQFVHVEWAGMRFEDLIMPLFMFLAGVSLPFSIECLLRSASSSVRKASMFALTGRGPTGACRVGRLRGR